MYRTITDELADGEAPRAGWFPREGPHSEVIPSFSADSMKPKQQEVHGNTTAIVRIDKESKLETTDDISSWKKTVKIVY